MNRLKYHYRKLSGFARHTLGCLIVIFLMIGILKQLPPDPPVDYYVTVIDKVIVPGGSKSSGSCYIVYKDDTGKVDQTDVTIAAYAQAHPGDRLVFQKHQSDFKSSWAHNFAVLCIVIMLCTLVCLFFGCAFWLFSKFE